MRKEVKVSLGNNEITPGRTVRATKREYLKGVIAGMVEEHEAVHAGLLILFGKGFRLATAEPDEFSLGRVEPYEFHAPSAAGPHRLNLPGTWGDVRMIEARGHSVEGAGEVAEDAMRGHKHQIDGIAKLLTVNRRINQAQAEEAMRKADEQEVEIVTTDPVLGRREFVRTIRRVDEPSLVIDVEVSEDTPEKSESIRDEENNHTPNQDHPLVDKVHGKVIPFKNKNPLGVEPVSKFGGYKKLAA
jgi:hypothetical protein